MKTLAAIALAGIIALTALVPVLTPCATEDSSMCNWDAVRRSNGQGLSFIALWDADTYIVYTIR